MGGNDAEARNYHGEWTSGGGIRQSVKSQAKSKSGKIQSTMVKSMVLSMHMNEQHAHVSPKTAKAHAKDHAKHGGHDHINHNGHTQEQNAIIDSLHMTETKKRK